MVVIERLMLPEPNPPEYPLDAGTLGITPGTGL